MKLIKQLPNLLTSANLFTGVLGIINVFQGDINLTIYYLVVSGVFDFLDGFAARLLKVQGEFGKQLDSLADMVTFGALPALYLFKVSQNAQHPDFITIATLSIAVFAALRLAKFNIDETQSDSFVGLNTPANSFLIVTITGFGAWTDQQYFVLGLTLFSCIAMIAPVRMLALKFKSFTWSGNEYRFLLIGLCIVGFAIIKQEFISFVIPVYIVLSVVGYLTSSKRD